MRTIGTKDALVGTATTQYIPITCGQTPEVQRGLPQVCAHSALYCPGGHHRFPVLSPIQGDGKVFLLIVEDWNLSHGVRFSWNSFLVPPNDSILDCQKVIGGQGGERNHNSHRTLLSQGEGCFSALWLPPAWTRVCTFSFLGCPMVD